MESASRATPHAADRGPPHQRRQRLEQARHDSSVQAGRGPAQAQRAAAIMEHRGHETGGTEHAAARYLL
jgi:hypothetical protein